jgi:uncharacterized protein HemY
MVFGSTVPSSLESFTPQQALELAKIYLKNALSVMDPKIVLELCHNIEDLLSKAKKAVKRAPDQTVVEGIATAYSDLGELLESRGHVGKAQDFFKKAQKLGYVADIDGSFQSLLGWAHDEAHKASI